MRLAPGRRPTSPRTAESGRRTGRPRSRTTAPARSCRHRRGRCTGWRCAALYSIATRFAAGDQRRRRRLRVPASGGRSVFCARQVVERRRLDGVDELLRLAGRGDEVEPRGATASCRPARRRAGRARCCRGSRRAASRRAPESGWRPGRREDRTCCCPRKEPTTKAREITLTHKESTAILCVFV